MSRSLVARLLAVGLGVGALITLGVLGRSEISPTQSISTAKLTLIAQYQGTEAANRLTANAYMSMGTIGPEASDVVPPASCPGDTPKFGIWDFTHTPIAGAYIINYAVAQGSTGDYYSVMAGAPDDSALTGANVDPRTLKAGLLLVHRRPVDPCATAIADRPASYFVHYNAPHGPLTILKIDGDVVVFGIEGGGTGRFNFVTGEFLP